MNKKELITLFDYNYWANNRIMDAAEQAGEEFFQKVMPSSFNGLRGTLIHILGTEWMWRMRCQDGISPTNMVSEQEFPTLHALRDRWMEEEKAMRAFLAWIDETDLNRPVVYANTKGKTFKNQLSEILTHVVNHGTQFRSEAGMLLTQAGHSPGDVDLIFFLRQKPDVELIEREKGMKAPQGSNPQG